MTDILVLILFPYSLLALICRHPNFYMVEGIVYLHTKLLTNFFFLGLFRAAPTAYGSSQARGRMEL